MGALHDPTAADLGRCRDPAGGDLGWNGQRPTACPHRGGMDRLYFLKPSNGVWRKTRTGSASERRVWKCGHCRKQFSVPTGTIFHGTKIPLRS